jgi:beta-mannosidase
MAITLDGEWRARAGDPETTRNFSEVAFDDRSWLHLPVPGHWRSSADFADHDGPVLYRTSFGCARLAWNRRAWLELDGVHYFGDVWLDGDYLGATEGYFAQHSFEVTEQLLTDETHVIAVEVASPPQRDRTAKRTVTGMLGHSDTLAETWNPGGIWRSVRIRETGPLRISRSRVLCTAATPEHARLRVTLAVDAGDIPPECASATAVVRRVDDGGAGVILASAVREFTPSRGRVDLTVDVDVEHPPLWWPVALGEQPLVDVSASVLVDGVTSDECRVRTGLRSVEVKDWIFSVNGERIFVKGAIHGPTRRALAEASAADLRRDVELALDANLDLLRLQAHVTRPEFYAAADELGLLLWQDVPLQWSYARGVRRAATNQARDMVDALGHHPSIALWCAHHEPFWVESTRAPMTTKLAVRYAASMFLPSWNKSVLDRAVTHALGAADPSRFVDPHSGVLPGPASLGTDAHLAHGWYHGQADRLPALSAAFPRVVRFVSGFGTQSVPAAAEFCDPDAWPHLDWDRLESEFGLQRARLEARVPVGQHATFASWRDATQRYQAFVLQLQIEDLRRIRYTPTGGFCFAAFADAQPAISWGVVDHQRQPKLADAAVRDACRPLLALVDPRTGDVHVVNDTRRPYTGVVEIDVDGVVTRFEGEVAADGIAWVGRVEVSGARQVMTMLDADTPIVHRAPITDGWPLTGRSSGTA